MNNNLSIFGSTGFIGSKYCELYPENIIRIDRNDYQPQSDNILYLISTTDNYNIFTDPHKDIDTNLSVLMNVLQNCKSETTINFVSSWFVYGSVNLPAREDSPTRPKGFYSITKKTAEDLLISYCETFGIKYRIFRLCNVIGENDKGVGKQKNALQYLIGQLKENKDISLYFSGNFYRDYLYVDDICSAINLCLDKAPISDIINIGSGCAYRFKELMQYCKTKLMSTSNIGTMEQPKFHMQVQVKDMCLDITKLKSLGFQSKYNIREVLDILCQ